MSAVSLHHTKMMMSTVTKMMISAVTKMMISTVMNDDNDDSVATDENMKIFHRFD